MPDDRYESDAEIIRAAYAERVRDVFKVFAENLGMGQGEKSSTDRFLRSLELIRKARDLALEASIGVSIVEPTALPAEGAATAKEVPLEPLSAEDQAMIEQAVGGTTGVARPVRLPGTQSGPHRS